MRTWQNAASWQDIDALGRRMTFEQAKLRRRFWRKLLREAAHLPFVEELLTAYYCAFDRQTPLYVKAVLVGALAYFVMPECVIPKFVSIIGLADDAAVLAAAGKTFSSHIKPEHREAARRTLAHLRSG